MKKSEEYQNLNFKALFEEISERQQEQEATWSAKEQDYINIIKEVTQEKQKLENERNDALEGKAESEQYGNNMYWENINLRANATEIIENNKSLHGQGLAQNSWFQKKNLFKSPNTTQEDY